MKRFIISVFVLLIMAGIAGVLWFSDFLQRERNIPSIQDITENGQQQEDIPKLTTIADNLQVPWDIAFLPDDTMLVTERTGNLLHIDTNSGEKTTVATLPQISQIGEGGLHGVILHPDFLDNNYIYLYYTYSANGESTQNKVSRFTYNEKSLSNEVTIIDNIPGSQYHDGGALAFGPDDYLYVTTGDAQQEDLAQNTDSLAGKILRLTEEGEPAPDNPFGNAIFSYGHRNPQGIDWDSENNLWSTEHGRSGAQSGLDEINRIETGNNYGWPIIEGDENSSGMQSPDIHSGSNTTWAPASAAILDGSLYFGGLRGNALYEADLDNLSVVKTHLKGELGRIRAVTVGPDDMLYISTSNRDGRGIPSPSDDRIIRVNPEKL